MGAAGSVSYAGATDKCAGPLLGASVLIIRADALAEGTEIDFPVMAGDSIGRQAGGSSR
jgi:hypothetical protein